ncbi:MAG: hypothetical protein L6R42_000456 [Xanthoria sp. 1 TBL-2021]|nr:MAG: hypothetical protein L6R42_000456 [Xanthoria sp. 1 TBL-2021]
MVRNRSSVSIPRGSRRGSRRDSDISTRAEDWSDCEAWVVDAYSGAAVHFPSSDKWLAAKIDKALNNGRAWRDFARLNERLRTELMRFLNDQKKGWSLVLIDTRNILGIRGLRSIRHDKWVRFIISPPRSIRNIIETEVVRERKDQKYINTSPWSRARQVHVPTAHDATLVLDNGHNVERERTGSRGEVEYVVRRGSGALERRAGGVECIPPREPPGGARNPHNDGPPPPQPTFNPYDYGPPPPPPTFNAYNYGSPPRRSTFMDNNRYPPQNQQLVVRDTNQQLARRSFERRRPPPPTFIPPLRRDLPNELSRRTGSPPREVGAKLSSVRQDSPPHDSSSDSGWKVVYPDESNMERALVLRHGGSPRVESYMREPVLNDSIRVRGEDVGETPVVVDGRTKRLSTLETTKPQVQTRRQKVPAQHRLHRNKYETSEEEDYVPNSNPPRHAGSGAKLTDEEVILKTLRKFTTFQGDVNPSSSGDIAISSASTTSSHGRRESTVKSRRASNDTVRSSWPAAAKERHGRIRDVSPAATATLEKEQKRPWEQSREQESALERRFALYDRDTGVISDEPTAMTGEDELIDVVESNAAKPSNELAHKSSAVNLASVHHDTGTDSFSGPEANDEITSQSHRRARFQEDEGLARDTGKNLIKRSNTEPISKAKPSILRSATVEDFGPEGEDRWTGGGAER